MFVAVLCCIFWGLVQHLSQSIIHSIQEWTEILEKDPILRRYLSPLQCRWPNCWVRVSAYLFSTAHQISSLETTCRHCSNLRSLMSWPALRVSPYLFAAHSTSSEVLPDYQIWCSPVFRCNRVKHGWIPGTASRYQNRHRLWFCCDSLVWTCWHGVPWWVRCTTTTRNEPDRVRELLNVTAKCHRVTSWGCTCFANIVQTYANERTATIRASYDESEWSLIISLICLLWRMYEESANRSLRLMCHMLDWTFVARIYNIQIKQRFVMEALIIRSQAKSFPKEDKAPCLFTLQERSEPGGFEKSTDVCPVVGMDPGSLNGWGPSGVDKGQSAKASSTVLRFSRLRQRQPAAL